MPRPDGKYLCFDFGTKRIGVAVGQSLTNTANPLPPLAADDGNPRWEEIQSLIRKWRPCALVVGIPIKMDGTTQPITKRAEDFATQLGIETALPVFSVDERLTTLEAREIIFAEGGYKALQKQSVDSMAAKLMLESWLKSSGE